VLVDPLVIKIIGKCLIGGGCPPVRVLVAADHEIGGSLLGNRGIEEEPCPDAIPVPVVQIFGAPVSLPFLTVVDPFITKPQVA